MWKLKQTGTVRFKFARQKVLYKPGPTLLYFRSICIFFFHFARILFVNHRVAYDVGFRKGKR